MDAVNLRKYALEAIKPFAPKAQVTADHYVGETGKSLYRLRMLAYTYKDAINRFHEKPETCLERFIEAVQRAHKHTTDKDGS